ncbi:hypothetical protein [Dictyobacter kobayashii]|uniref:GIY-YIG domain-containing protein n=1 Tax=Dictyobacter kobayashii TaxID=2014872 RepID=A0A402ASF5_9CHLR|nr:hypothetical protein [Dictyobacter kobayashii]GCE22027.1 hypothetical protein KDK_58270 [Dictyobacter kobayashii]
MHITEEQRHRFITFMRQDYPQSLKDYMDENNDFPEDYPYKKPEIGDGCTELVIYELHTCLLPQEHNIFYIGYTSNLTQRFTEHRNSALHTGQTIEDIYAEYESANRTPWAAKKARRKIIGASLQHSDCFSITSWETLPIKPQAIDGMDPLEVIDDLFDKYMPYLSTQRDYVLERERRRIFAGFQNNERLVNAEGSYRHMITALHTHPLIGITTTFLDDPIWDPIISGFLEDCKRLNAHY